MIEQLNFSKMNGLIPAVVQDAESGLVLMVGFMNREALQCTLDQNQVVFWSRSKKRLWKKGESSGNYLNVISVTTDCDNDAVLIQARPTGPVCHTGTPSCFPVSAGRENIVERLFAIIRDRKTNKPDGSYTTSLFSGGRMRIAQKVGEEAVELSIAAQYPDKKSVIAETADLLYHTLVLLAEREIELTDVYAELAGRMKT
jgi:phosphoribosyl-AMP cyclohydrolase / phosphoribosyl-ATP pyrophosphohydrolase